MQERRAVAALTLGRARVRRLLLALGVAGVVVLVDQVTKSLAEDRLHHPVHLVGPLGLGLERNTGSAFSLFTGEPAVLAAVAGVLIVALGWIAWRARRPAVVVGLGLIIGGAVGNLVDRLARGHHGAVVDFVTLSHWPTFNVADASITVGVVLVAALVAFGPRHEPRR